MKLQQKLAAECIMGIQQQTMSHSLEHWQENGVDVRYPLVEA